MIDLLNYIYDHLVGRRAMPLAIAATILGVFLVNTQFSKKYLDKTLAFTVNITFFIVVVAAIGYLFYPSYTDHAESMIANLGIMLSKGEQIYPSVPNNYLHGTIYGPGLFEIQSVFQWTQLPVILASKVPGLVALFSSLVLLFASLKSNIGRGYLLLLIPFGQYLFWNRPEPFFLLTVAGTLFLSSRSRDLWAVLIIGGLAAIASSFKIHGAMYVVAAGVAVWPLKELSIRNLIAFSVGFLIVSVLTFVPEQISFKNYLAVMVLASKHGLSLKYLTENIFYLVGMTLPILFVLISSPEARSKYLLNAIGLIGFELITALVGSKPGAGAHHLLPFIPINAYLLQQCLLNVKSPQLKIEPLKFGLIAMSIGGFIHAMNIVKSGRGVYPTAGDLVSEVVALASAYPSLVLGLGDDSNYQYMFVSPILEDKGFHQLNYPSYLDLNFSGIGDDALVSGLDNCRFPYIAVPTKGEAFSMKNPYTGKPLFSDKVRTAFADRYKKVSEKSFYTVYGCAN